MVSTSPNSEIPSRLITDRGGPSQRLRVDPGQTGFFAGRMFRTYTEQIIPVAGPSVQFRFVAPVDFILWSQILTLLQGAIRLQIFTAGTPSGVWTELPIIGINRMAERPSPYYTPLCTVATGGDFTGGTEVDRMLVRASSNLGNQGSQNVGGETTERGLPAGTYYGRLSTLTGGASVVDAAQLIYSLFWEERVP